MEYSSQKNAPEFSKLPHILGPALLSNKKQFSMFLPNELTSTN